MGGKGRAEEVLGAFFLFPFFKMPLKKHTPLPIPLRSPPKFFTLCDCKSFQNFCLERGGFSELLFFPDCK